MNRKIYICEKSSTWDLVKSDHKNPIVKLSETNPSVTASVLASHHAQLDNGAQIISRFRERGASFTYVKRDDKFFTSGGRTFGEGDVLITIGGDGTFLWASQFVGSGAVLIGINSDPIRSVGHFCAASAEEIDSVIDLLLGPEEVLQKRCINYSRLRVTVDGVQVADNVLNDVLYCARHPADMTRYQLSFAGGCEGQKSSGIWFATPAGSTAAIRSAGGMVVDPRKHSDGQFMVRELYIRPQTAEVEGLQRFPRRAGFFGTGSGNASVSVLNRTADAILCIDGSSHVIELDWGATIQIFADGVPLCALSPVNQSSVSET